MAANARRVHAPVACQRLAERRLRGCGRLQVAVARRAVRQHVQRVRFRRVGHLRRARGGGGKGAQARRRRRRRRRPGRRRAKSEGGGAAERTRTGPTCVAHTRTISPLVYVGASCARRAGCGGEGRWRPEERRRDSRHQLNARLTRGDAPAPRRGRTALRRAMRRASSSAAGRARRAGLCRVL